jgi:hemoglobin-like flavoprotein
VSTFTRAEAELVRAAMRTLMADAPAAGACFYAHLFRLAPQLRGLFVTDVARQGMKLMETLAAVAEQIDNWGALDEKLSALALRHTAYGVRPADYAPVGVALRLMLAERLGPACTPEMEAAWRHAYAAVEAEMRRAGYPLGEDLAG